MRILIIEDDIKIASFIQKGLKREGYIPIHASDGQKGLDILYEENIDLAIVDIMLPKLDGLQLIEISRQKGISVPFLVLSAKRSITDKVRGLQAGGDDYLVKPFAFAELLARIQALIRRSQLINLPDVIEIGNVVLNIPRRKVTRNGKEVELQPKEFALLEYLMRNRGRIISKTMIMENVWDYNFDPGTNVVEARICRLRDKIDKNSKSPLIHTIRGVGYVCDTKK